MARPAPPVDTIRVAINGHTFGHKYTNVFWASVVTDGTKTVNDLAALLDLFLSSYDTTFGDSLDLHTTYGTADGVWQTGASTVLADTRSINLAGDLNDPIDDASACYVISWKIAARYRGGKPRTYLPGPTAGNVTNGSTVTGAALTALNGNAVAFMAAINGFTGTHISACQLGTVSFFTAGGSETLPPTYRTPPVFEPYIGSGVRSTIGTQRRRILS
jgi:hypothetical protein